MDARDVVRQIWAGLDGDASAVERLALTGPEHTLPSAFEVTGAAVAAIAAATLAVEEVRTRRCGAAPAALSVDSRHAAHAVASERFVRAEARDLGGVWDPIAGVYRAADGWIRLHTNFRRHRAAAQRVLALDGPDVDRDAVAAAVAGWSAGGLEAAIDDAGGCAAVGRSRDDWRRSETARALAAEPLVRTVVLGAPAAAAGDPATAVGAPADRPLAGLRVLDLTRVIAGPAAGRFLAAYGADVLRIDGPAAEDSLVLIADTTVGKRSAVVDLADASGAAAFARLLALADVVLCAYRPGSLARHGLAPGALAAARPGLVVGTLSAYGGVGLGPWGGRRGFDSLVQMATGIADEGRRAAGADPDAPPVPLPVQLLDHASGYLLAAGVLRALARRWTDGRGREVRVSLARTSAWLDGLGRGGAADVPPLPAACPDDLTVALDGPFGRTHHVACPGSVDGAPPRWDCGPVPLGHDAPEWR